MAVSQMSTICPIRAHVSLILSKYPTWCRFTFEPCHHDLTRAFVYPSCLVFQDNVISNRVEDRFSLEVLTPMGDVVLNVEIWESSFPFWAFNWVDGPRRLSNGAQHKESHEAQSNSTMMLGHSCTEGIVSWETDKFPSFNGSKILLLHGQGIFHCFLCPSFVNLGMRFLLRGEGCNTPCYFFL
jgi:hypothetical protein